jgi:hypothetical protein
VDDFEGTAFITQNLILDPRQSKIVDLILVPVCTSTDVLNPSVHVETDDEDAYVPLIINIEGVYVDEDNCAFYYNESVCNSPYYIRIEGGKSYSIDLSKWFYDPDSDNLQYSYSNSANLEIKINKNTATIKPKDSWKGTEKIEFYASDEKGGKASSNAFYVHSVTGSPTFWDGLLKLLGI